MAYLIKDILALISLCAFSASALLWLDLLRSLA